MSRDRRDDGGAAIGPDRLSRWLGQRLRSRQGVDHRLRADVLLGHRELRLRPLLADPLQRRRRHLVEQLCERVPAQPQAGQLGDQGGGITAQRGVQEVLDGLLADLYRSLRDGHRQRTRRLVLPPLHERRHVAQAELPVTARGPEAIDLSGIGPPLDGGLPNSEQRCDLSRR